MFYRALPVGERIFPRWIDKYCDATVAGAYTRPLSSST